MKYLPLLLMLFVLTSCSSGFHQKREFPLDKKLKLCFIGDTGKDSETQKAAADALLTEDCHSVYVLGDIIYPNGLDDKDDPQAEEKFFRHYRPVYLTSPQQPVFHILLGNHDYGGDPDAWRDIAKENPMVFAPTRYYFQEYSGICIASFDTNLPKFFFDFPKQMGQKFWFKDFDERMKKHCHVKIALGHHPYISSGKTNKDAIGSLKNFLEDVIIGEFDYYLAGHDHILSYEGKQKGTELYVSGAGGNPSHGQAPGYVTMDITKAGEEFKVTTTLKRVEKGKVQIEAHHSKVFSAAQVP